jgi:ATP-dependent protease ClpP protease subunit
MLAGLVPVDAFPTEPQDAVYILGMITEEDGADTYIGDIDALHKILPDGAVLQINISSPGGDVYLGGAIASKIQEVRRSGRKVHAHVTGYAWSAAFDILQACDIRTMEPTASLMTHEEQILPEERLSSSKLKDEAVISKALEAAQFQLWSARTGRPISYYQKMTRYKEWYLTAEEALGEGFVDEITAIVPYEPTPATAPMKRTKKVITEDEDDE